MPTSDLFRLLLLRPPQSLVVLPDDPVIELLAEDDHGTLLSELNHAVDTSAMIKVADAFRRSDRFLPGLEAVSRELATLGGDAKHASDPGPIKARLANLGHDERALADILVRLKESLAVALIRSDSTVGERHRLEIDIRHLSLLIALAGEAAPQLSQARKRLSATVALPTGIFPLSRTDSIADAAAADHAERQDRLVAARMEAEAQAKRIDADKAAIDELLRLYRQDNRIQAQAASAATTDGKLPESARSQSVAASLPGAARSTATDTFSVTAPPVLSDKVAASLSGTTLAQLKSVDQDSAYLNVGDAIGALEADMADAADRLYRGGVSGQVLKLGGLYVPQDALSPGSDVFAPTDWPVRVPGRCSPAEAEPPQPDETSVPTTVGRFHSLGIGDLLVVRQRLLRYEMGEVAHVENVMAFENRQREHRQLDSIETVDTSETDTIEETSRDLESAERFELQTESTKTIDEMSSRQAGITVTASYGMSIDVTANAGFSSETAKSAADVAAAAYSREIVERSAHSLQERTLKRRVLTTVSETELINAHGFDNQTDTSVTGIYRWLDKISEAQVFNYGKREIVNIVVPEPAAFFRYASGAKPKEGATLRKPEPPGYCITRGDRFEPLEPKDITQTSYKLWIARYGVADAEPPPPVFRIVGAAMHETINTENPGATAQSSEKIKMPTGYSARRAWLAATHVHFPDDADSDAPPKLVVFVGRKQINSGGNGIQLDGEDDIVPVSVAGARLLAYAATIEVECERTLAHYEGWQIDVFNKVMRNYDLQVAAYEAALREDENRFEDFLAGARNPGANRIIQHTELKRGAIAQLTGQHFDLFNAMRYDTPPEGYPQADVAEADAEGLYIQFVEQAFEWENMQYLFYPYFWGRKQKWPLVSQMEDRDPLFAEFLRAGAARVNLPVRPGFESAVNTFLSTGLLPWSSDPSGEVVIDDDLFLSIAEEMRARNGAVYTKSEGRIAVVQGSADVTGTGTAFDADDIRREITILGEVYRIGDVASAEALTLTRAYAGANADGAGYVIGAKAVGEPWTVRVPTSLVMLQPDANLPTFSSAGDS